MALYYNNELVSIPDDTVIEPDIITESDINIKRVNADHYDALEQKPDTVYVVAFDDIYDEYRASIRQSMFDNGYISDPNDSKNKYGDDLDDDAMLYMGKRIRLLKLKLWRTAGNFWGLLKNDSNIKYIYIDNISLYVNNDAIFDYLPNVEYLDMSGLSIGECKSLSYFLQDTSNLKYVNMSGLDTSNVTSLAGFFLNSGIKTIDISYFDFSSCTDISKMFYNCKVEELDFSGKTFPVVTKMSQTFQKSSLRHINFGNATTPVLDNLYMCITDCPYITLIDYGQIGSASLTSINYCAQNNSECLSITIGQPFVTTNVTTFGNPFGSNTKLLTFNCYELDFINSTDATLNIFNNNTSMTTINGVFKNIKNNFNVYKSPLTRQSALVIINGLANLTGQTSKTITFSSTTKNLLTDADRLLITNKNWTIA